MIKKTLVSLGLFVLIVAATGYIYIHKTMTHSAVLSESVTVNIAKGSSLNAIAQQLVKVSLLESPVVFVAYARLNHLSQKLKAGEYRFKEEVSPLSILNQLIAGDVTFYTVTLLEGNRYIQILQHLWSQPQLKATLKEKTEKEVIEFLGTKHERLEGLLFPDTYRFTSGETDLNIIKRAYEKMQRVLAEEWGARSKGLPYQDDYDALVMASIVEKETGLASERADIAGVFVRRLQKNMRLQTDPTVIFGLGEEFDGNLTRGHLRKKTAYNTYVNYGLPPTPIAIPGREAIHAALHPAAGTSLYFVAKGDGSHEFTSNFSDHNKAVIKYQKRRVKNYRSSPLRVPNKTEINNSDK